MSARYFGQNFPGFYRAEAVRGYHSGGENVPAAIHFYLMSSTGKRNATSNHAGLHALGDCLNLSPGYPFAAVVGLETARLALLLLAIEPRLKGALIGAVSGSAKTTLSRAFKSIFQAQAGDAPPFIEVPLNVSDDRLLSGIDIERTIVSGRKHLTSGLLAQADGGVLFVDHASLLDDAIANHIAAALDTGEVRVEREGLSAESPAKFVLVAAFNPEEGEVSPRLRSRAGLIIETTAPVPPDARVEIISRAAAFHESPLQFCSQFEGANESIARTVASARERLARVAISIEYIRKLSLVALSLGVEGNTWDLVAVRAARASAALAERDEVTEADVITAIQLVLAPRARTMPEPGGERNERDDFEPNDRSNLDEGAPGHENTGERRDEKTDPAPDFSGQIEELIVRAIDSEAMELNPALLKSKRPSTPSGRRALDQSAQRGRHIRNVEPKQAPFKIAVAATLRAAAPFQKRRRARGKERERNGALGSSGGKIARGAGVKIEPSDLRFKQFKRRSGMLFVFAIDGSGSMAMNRMAQAKGAMIRLLQEAYLHRDKVALVGFRGSAAEILMPPTRSVEIAKRLIDAMPSGGGTPLAAGLIQSLKLARLSRLRRLPQCLVVVFTDGRANVGMEQAGHPGSPRDARRIAEELRRVGGAFQAEGIESIVIDTRAKFISQGEARELAGMLGGRYLYLPRPDSASIYKAVTSAASSLRAGPSAG